MEIGTRVGAILGAKDGVVELFGYGVYSGEEVPPKDAGGFCPLLHEIGRTNPKITLDNGEVVWGAECWWGPEEKIRQQCEGRTVVIVSPRDARGANPQ